MTPTHKILVLDDDADWLEACREIFADLPRHPEVRTALSSSRALAMLEAEPFHLLISDLKMPRMDGLQVLSIVRRRFPQLRTVVLSGLEDEEFRARAYALGVDLFWLKPDMQRNLKTFLDCLESLLRQDEESGFRGIQSKSLLDLLQIEGLARSSCVLRITRKALIAKLWLLNGELIDAEAEGLSGEAALRRILAWKSGAFESLPPEPERPRTIQQALPALLLEYAQEMDETPPPCGESPLSDEDQARGKLSLLPRAGAEWVVAVPADRRNEPVALGNGAAKPLTAWIRLTMEISKTLADHMEAGPLLYMAAHGLEKNCLLLPREKTTFLAAWPAGEDDLPLLEKTKKIIAAWDS